MGAQWAIFYCLLARTSDLIWLRSRSDRCTVCEQVVWEAELRALRAERMQMPVSIRINWLQKAQGVVALRYYNAYLHAETLWRRL